MISRTLGAPLGGTTRGGHHGLDWSALRLISPPNAGAGGGRTSPGIGRAAAGEPKGGASWAAAGSASVQAKAIAAQAAIHLPRTSRRIPRSPLLAGRRRVPRPGVHGFPPKKDLT